jgi:hypothetical protein
LQTITELASLHELLTTWHETADSLNEALQKRITPTRDVLEYLLEPYEPDEPDPQAQEELLHALGYSFFCWTGQADDNRSIGLNTSCGGAIGVDGICNRLVLTLPDVSETSLYQPDVMLGILRVIANAWDPDWAVVMNIPYRDEYIFRDDYDPPSGKPYVGWMTYLRDKRLAGLTGAPPCEMVNVPGRGRIFVVTREHRFSVQNPDDIAGARKLTEYLEAGGALVTIPTNEPF